MNNKYNIDGVEYEYGEEVEVTNDDITWHKETFIHHWVGEYGQNIIIVEKDTFPYIRKVRPKTNKERVIEYLDGAIKQGSTLPVMAQNLAEIFDEIYERRTPSLSGRKATLILDGAEHTVTFE